MDDGLSIRWRETAPDRALISMALGELALLQEDGGTSQCEIVIERVLLPERVAYRAQVELGRGLGRRQRDKHVCVAALRSQPSAALRSAFSQLRTLATAAA